MKRIRKSDKHYRKTGHLLVRQFLNKAWDGQLKQYINCTYPDFKKDGRMERLLLDEQHHKCCYCMRSLEYGKHTTIEHVLPHKETDPQNADKYFRYCGNLRKHVRLYLIGADNKSVRLKVPKYPHFCAYENLVLSCDGSIYDDIARSGVPTGRLHNCCNNARGKNYIVPLFFKRHIKKYVEYDDDGILKRTDCMPKAMWLDFAETVHRLRLNQDTLKLFRKAWRLVGECGYTVSHVLNARNSDENDPGNDDGMKVKIIAAMMLGMAESDKLKNKDYWSLFCQYSYFHTYYKHKKNIFSILSC